MSDDTERLIVRFDAQARSIRDLVSCASLRRRAGVQPAQMEAVVTFYEHEDKVHFGCARGFHASAEAAVEIALADLRAQTTGLEEAHRKRNECVVCGCAGVVTTGEGMMCREHAMRWLQGEASVSDMLGESEEKDMG